MSLTLGLMAVCLISSLLSSLWSSLSVSPLDWSTVCKLRLSWMSKARPIICVGTFVSAHCITLYSGALMKTKCFWTLPLYPTTLQQTFSQHEKECGSLGDWWICLMSEWMDQFKHMKQEQRDPQTDIHYSRLTLNMRKRVATAALVIDESV